MSLCLIPGRPFDLFPSPCTPMVLREPLMLGLNCPDVQHLTILSREGDPACSTLCREA